MSNFKVKVEEDKYMGNLLSTTNNGYQWVSIGLKNDDEVNKVIEALSIYMDDNKIKTNPETDHY